MIDTHSHIYEPVFNADREDIIMRAKQVGVERILLPNINAESIDQMLGLCHQYPDYCFPMMGLHPTDIEDDYKQVLADMEKLLAVPDHPYIAVGEVGLDYYWDKGKGAGRDLPRSDRMGHQVSLAAHDTLSFSTPSTRDSHNRVHGRTSHRCVPLLWRNNRRSRGVAPVPRLRAWHRWCSHLQEQSIA